MTTRNDHDPFTLLGAIGLFGGLVLGSMIAKKTQTPTDPEWRKAQDRDAASNEAFKSLHHSLKNTLRGASKTATAALSKAVAPLADAQRRLSTQAELLLIEPSIEPLLDPQAGDAALGQARSDIAAAECEYGRVASEACNRHRSQGICLAAGDQRFAWRIDPAKTRVYYDEALRAALRKRRDEVDGLEREIERMRGRLIQRDTSVVTANEAPVGDPTIAFVYGVQFDPSSLDVLSRALQSPASPTLKELFAAQSKDEIARAAA